MTFLALMAAAFVAQATPEPAGALRPGLEPLGFLVGHCWRGTFATGETDVHCFESVFDGQHVRDRHEVTGGERVYRGETLFSAGPGAEVAFIYFNSLGGVSRGTMRAEDERLEFGDEIYRGADGRTITVSTAWRRVAENAYESVATSSDSPSMNRTVRFERVTEPVDVSQTRAPDGTWTLRHETVVDAPVAMVWRAISTAEGWRGWAAPRAWMTEAEPDLIETSYDPDARPGEPATIRHRILASVPERMLAFRTIKAPGGFPDFDAYRRTLSVLEIEPVGESRARVRVIGAGYPDTEAGRRLLGFFRDGNRIVLQRMQQMFVTGPVDWPAVAEGGP